MIDNIDDGCQYGHQKPDHSRAAERHILRLHLCGVLRGDLAEENDEDGEDRGRGSDGCISEEADGDQGRERGGGYIDDVVADENRAEHLGPFVRDGEDGFCPPVILLRKRLDPYAVHGCKCGLKKKKK